VPGNFTFDQKKTAQENIADFLAHIEAQNPALGLILRRHIAPMVPLPADSIDRNARRTAFNKEIRKDLDVVLAALQAKHD
jgi:hypothetical protein